MSYGLRDRPVSPRAADRWILSSVSVHVSATGTTGVTTRVKRQRVNCRPDTSSYCSIPSPFTMSSLPIQHIETSTIVIISVIGALVVLGTSLALMALIWMRCIRHRQHPMDFHPIPLTRTERRHGVLRPKDPSQGSGSRV